jgi:hypothetical protein
VVTGRSGSCTNADLQAFVTAMIGALTACGMVQTTDTGQVTAATAATPTAPSTLGYLIFRLADSLQATAPVFLKITFGASGNGWGGWNNTPANLGFYVQVGTGTDGAGNLTGNKTQSFYCAANGNGLIAAQSYASGDGSRIAYFAGVGVGAAGPVNGSSGGQNGNQLFNTAIGFAIDRDKNADGTDSANGVTVIWHTQANASIAPSNIAGFNPQWDVQYLPSTGNVPPSQGVNYLNGYMVGSRVGKLCFQGGAQSAQAYGTGVGVEPVFPWSQAFRNPTLAGVGYSTLDLPNDYIFSAQIMGVSHTFRTLGNWANAFSQTPAVNPGTSTNAYVADYRDGFAMRWE